MISLKFIANCEIGFFSRTNSSVKTLKFKKNWANWAILHGTNNENVKKLAMHMIGSVFGNNFSCELVFKVVPCWKLTQLNDTPTSRLSQSTSPLIRHYLCEWIFESNSKSNQRPTVENSDPTCGEQRSSYWRLIQGAVATTVLRIHD